MGRTRLRRAGPAVHHQPRRPDDAPVRTGHGADRPADPGPRRINPGTADEFARAVQALLLDPELVKDLDIRDEQIACLAIDYAAQFLPGGIRYPARQPDRR